MSSGISEREGLRMTGEYTLTEEDVLSGRKFHDGVVKSAWPVELWDQKKGPSYRYLDESAYYEIPLRCLKSRNIKIFTVQDAVYRHPLRRWDQRGSWEPVSLSANRQGWLQQKKWFKSLKYVLGTNLMGS